MGPSGCVWSLLSALKVHIQYEITRKESETLHVPIISLHIWRHISSAPWIDLFPLVQDDVEYEEDGDQVAVGEDRFVSLS